MVLFRLIFSPLKIALFVARVVGYNRVFLFLLGVAVGLLVAPTTGAELRRRLQEELRARLDPGAAPIAPVAPGDLIGRDISTVAP